MNTSSLFLFKKLFSNYELKRVFYAVYMDLLNFCFKRLIVGQRNVVVSMTSYGNRIKQVHRAIESIGRGIQKPKRFILWLAKEDFEKPLPKALS